MIFEGRGSVSRPKSQSIKVLISSYEKDSVSSDTANHLNS